MPIFSRKVELYILAQVGDKYNFFKMFTPLFWGRGGGIFTFFELLSFIFLAQSGKNLLFSPIFTNFVESKG